MSKEIKLYFRKCTEPEEAFQFEKMLKNVGLTSTFTFIDKLNCFKLTAKIVCVNKKVFEDTKKAIVVVKFGKVVGGGEEECR